MDLYQLRYFLEAVRERNFTRAARRLHLAQAALSEQIRNLEDELGAPLFHRGRRETRPTAAGEALARHAERLLEMAERARQELQDLSGLRGGRLVVGAIPSVGAAWLAPLLAGLRRRHPRVELAVIEDTSDQVAAAVEQGRAELGLVQGPVSLPGLDSRPLFQEPFVLVVPARHPLARRPRVALVDIADEPVVLYKGRAREAALAACRAAGFEPAIAGESGELATVAALVRAGLGVALLPRLAAPGRGTGCRTLLMTGHPVRRDVVLVTRRGESPSPAGAALTERILEAVRHVASVAQDSRSRQ